jgi:formylglycine-generating enzyme required for sulfatase activity/SAM-dependent methyltransferase
MEECVQFRNDVKAAVERVIETMPHPRDVPVTMESPYWALYMGFEHERIHLETSSVLLRQLPIDAVRVPRGWRTAPTFALTPADAPANALVSVPASVVTIGKERDFPSYGWDNEYGKRVVEVPAFEAARFKCSNAEFLPFVLGGGYEDRQWWVSAGGDDEGWRWKTFRRATHPSFWVAPAHPDMQRFHGGTPDWPYQKDDGHPRAGSGPAFRLRTAFDIIDMPWDWPVEVNALEATAFLRWKAASEGVARTVTYRMVTEAEFHALRGTPEPFAESTVVAAEALSGEPCAAEALGGKGGCGAGLTLLSAVEGDVPPAHGACPDGEDAEALARAGWAIAAKEGKARAARLDIAMQPTAPGNINFRWHSSTPVNMYPPTSTGFYDVHGNVWEWAEDHFAPLPGFEIHYLYDDFSAPCFDGWHNLILGGSWASTGELASDFARYHFRRHFFQHLGFRYVRIDSTKPALGVDGSTVLRHGAEAFPGAGTVSNLWEGMSTVSNDITNSFAKSSDLVPFPAPLVAPENAANYHATLGFLAAKAYESHVLGATPDPAGPAPSLREAVVLHLGCGVGGGTFELSKAGFGKVVGVDNREVAIRHARVMQHHGQLEYERVKEGVLSTTALVKVPGGGSNRAAAVFALGDACNLPEDVLAYGPFDVVVVDAILTRQTQPLDLTKKLSKYVRPGGLCVIASNNDWDPKVTPRNSWIGGYKMNGEDMPTLHVLNHLLKREFAFLETADIARLTRNHHRRFVLDVMETSVWRRCKSALFATTPTPTV